MENMGEFIWWSNCRLIQIEEIRIRLCIESYLKEASFIGINHRTVYPITQNPDVPQPSQHHQNVRLFWRLKKHLYHFVGWNWRTALPLSQKITDSSRGQSRLSDETSLRSCQWNSLSQDHSSRYKTLKYCSSWRTFIINIRILSSCVISDGVFIKTTSSVLLFVELHFMFVHKSYAANNMTKKLISGHWESWCIKWLLVKTPSKSPNRKNWSKLLKIKSKSLLMCLYQVKSGTSWINAFRKTQLIESQFAN